MRFIAKPRTANSIDQKTFEDVNEAIKYLEEKTGYSMGYQKKKKKGKIQITYDWEIIGKLIRVEENAVA